MNAALILMLINCAEPRMDFREFYQKQHGRYPGSFGEDTFQVQERVANSAADFIEYAATYRIKCGVN